MKLVFILSVMLQLSVAFAQDLFLQDYNYTLTDVARKGLTKEQVFASMERNFVKLGSSICSNRAHVWAWDFERELQISSAKLFLFYSEKTGEAGRKEWWYHVAPMINEAGQLWVVDAGFPSFVRSPLKKEEWFQKFASSTNCKEITNEDTDLVEYIFNQRRFPNSTRYGAYDCYYRITSAPYWTPRTLAQEILGRDSNGRSGNFNRSEIQIGELMQACQEASTSPIGGIFSNRRKRCLEYLGLE